MISSHNNSHNIFPLKLSRCGSFWVKLQWTHKWRLCQVSKRAPSGRWKNYCAPGQRGRGYGELTILCPFRCRKEPFHLESMYYARNKTWPCVMVRSRVVSYSLTWSRGPLQPWNVLFLSYHSNLPMITNVHLSMNDASYVLSIHSYKMLLNMNKTNWFLLSFTLG